MFIKKLNLQFFAADDGGQGGGNGGQGDNGGDQSGAGSTKTENMIPQTRLNEEIQKKKDLQAQLDKLTQEKEQAETDAKKKQGEFEELYTNLSKEHDPLKTQFKQYQDTFNEILKVKLTSVPEEFQDLIPEGDDLSKLQWIEKSIAKGLFKKDTVTDFGNAGSNPGNQETDLSKMNPKQLLSMGYEKSKK